jgi:hypothetical protein
MIEELKPPFCQTRVSGSTFVNADCFDVFPFIENGPGIGDARTCKL